MRPPTAVGHQDEALHVVDLQLRADPLDERATLLPRVGRRDAVVGRAEAVAEL